MICCSVNMQTIRDFVDRSHQIAVSAHQGHCGLQGRADGGPRHPGDSRRVQCGQQGHSGL